MPSQKTANPEERLWTAPFVALNLAMLLSFCNMSIFFQFQGYLHDLNISASQAGLVIGLFSFSALIIRPVIIPFLHPHNARRWIGWGILGTVVCLASYKFFNGFFSLSVLRLVHGAFYVLMAAAAMSALTACIPPSKSGQAFGVIGVVALLPFALVPPILPTMEELLGGYTNLLSLTALPIAAIFLLLPWIKPTQDTGETQEAIKWAELKQNLRSKEIWILLGLSLVMYSAFAITFFFIENFADGLHITNPGLFFTLSTGAEVAARLGMSPLLDRLGKKGAIQASLAVLVLSYLALSYTTGAWMFFSLAVIFGLSWGVVVPASGALLFDISPPRFRALNTNMGLEMMQGGYFMGPLLGGLVLHGLGYRPLFMLCAGACLLGMVFMAFSVKEKNPPTDSGAKA